MILENQKLYYGNSALLNKLKYYPAPFAYYYVVFCLGLLFLPQHKIATQNKLWAGMAKETASNNATFFHRMGRNLEIGKC
jgi:hypothetical protein